MIEVRNLLFQPLTFHLKGGGENLHLGPRQRRVIADDQVSPELDRARKRGLVILTELNGATPQLTAETQAKPTAGRTRKGRN